MTPSEEYRTIPLPNGLSVIVDAADFEWLNQWKWRVIFNRSKDYYAVRYGPKGMIGNHSERIWMHRLILGLEKGDGRVGDHRNLNTLDNRRENLRIATVSQNNCNQPTSKRNTSGFKGVSKYGKNRWIAQIQIHRKQIHLGYYGTPEEAHAAYCEAAKRFHGEFARTA